MHKTIALFNHKGGVSKTTTTFNLGWMLAEKGAKVVMIDTDPQCNLTGLVLCHRIRRRTSRARMALKRRLVDPARCTRRIGR